MTLIRPTRRITIHRRTDFLHRGLSLDEAQALALAAPDVESSGDTFDDSAADYWPNNGAGGWKYLGADATAQSGTAPDVGIVDWGGGLIFLQNPKWARVSGGPGSNFWREKSTTSSTSADFGPPHSTVVWGGAHTSGYFGFIYQVNGTGGGTSHCWENVTKILRAWSNGSQFFSIIGNAVTDGSIIFEADAYATAMDAQWGTQNPPMNKVTPWKVQDYAGKPFFIQLGIIITQHASAGSLRARAWLTPPDNGSGFVEVFDRTLTNINTAGLVFNGVDICSTHNPTESGVQTRTERCGYEGARSTPRTAAPFSMGW